MKAPKNAQAEAINIIDLKKAYIAALISSSDFIDSYKHSEKAADMFGQTSIAYISNFINLWQESGAKKLSDLNNESFWKSFLHKNFNFSKDDFLDDDIMDVRASCFDIITMVYGVINRFAELSEVEISLPDLSTTIKEGIEEEIMHN